MHRDHETTSGYGRLGGFTFVELLATVVLIVVSAWGGHEFKLREVTFLYLALAIFSVAVFIYGLGLPMNIWPELG